MMDEKKYRLDKTAFVATTVSEANDHVNYWNDKTAAERLNAACFIINQIFQVTPQTKVDFSVFTKRKRD
jgi:hypothetical protein